MGANLEQFMRKHLGVSLSDVKKMDDEALDDLYERACDLEVDMAIKAEETPEGETQDSIFAANLVDFLYAV